MIRAGRIIKQVGAEGSKQQHRVVAILPMEAQVMNHQGHGEQNAVGIELLLQAKE